AELRIVAREQGRNDGGVGGGTADAPLLQRLDQAGFRVPWRWLGEVLVGEDVVQDDRLALDQRGQPHVVVIVRRIVAALQVDRDEARSYERRAGGAKAPGFRPLRRQQLDRQHVVDRGFHLGRDRALPDQRVQLEL